jgi:hypothetical protein
MAQPPMAVAMLHNDCTSSSSQTDTPCNYPTTGAHVFSPYPFNPFLQYPFRPFSFSSAVESYVTNYQDGALPRPRPPRQRVPVPFKGGAAGWFLAMQNKYQWAYDELTASGELKDRVCKLCFSRRDAIRPKQANPGYCQTCEHLVADSVRQNSAVSFEEVVKKAQPPYLIQHNPLWRVLSRVASVPPKKKSRAETPGGYRTVKIMAELRAQSSVSPQSLRPPPPRLPP